ncbi:MAG: helix-turn-helix domain-containing protein, partial [Xanthobacteraceae bacterium]
MVGAGLSKYVSYMARYRFHSKKFKRQIAQEFLAGATLYGLAKVHHLSRQLIRVWVSKYEAGAFHEDAQAADLLHDEAENSPFKQVERFFDLAQENRTLARIERTLIVRMAHIYQGKHKNNEIAALISAHDQKQFLTHLAPAFHHKSPFYRTRAFLLTFYLMGIPISLIAEFFLISRR